MAYHKPSPEEVRLMSSALPTIVQAVIDFRKGSVPTNEEDDKQLDDARNGVFRAIRFYRQEEGKNFRQYVYDNAMLGLREGAQERETSPHEIMPHAVDQSPAGSPPIAGPRALQNRPEWQAL